MFPEGPLALGGLYDDARAWWLLDLARLEEDQLLPFDAAEVLRDQLTEAGAVVAWQPFAGGHEIPPPVVDAARTLLRGLA